MTTIRTHPFPRPLVAATILVTATISFVAGARLSPPFLSGHHVHAVQVTENVACETPSMDPHGLGVVEHAEVGADCNTNLR